MIRNYFAFSLLAAATFLPQLAFAASVSIDALSPGSAVPAKQLVTFNILTSGFTSPYFQISDSFSNSTVGSSNVNGGGHFTWVPTTQDAGTHVITVTARDYSGNVATTNVSVTVTPPPSASLTVSPSSAAIPTGTQVFFAVVTKGFTNPSYSLSDSFSSGSSLSQSTIDASGQFHWTPDLSQEGDHYVSVYVSDASGASATVNATVHVGPLPTLTIDNLRPGMNAPIGTTTTFSLRPTGYIPTVFGVYDKFSGSTSLSPNAISASGQFSWIPQPQDIGVHVITVTASIGPFGKSASTTQTYIIYDPAKTSTAAATASSVSTPAPSVASVNTTGVTTSSSGFKFSESLSNGSEGAEVMELQKLLTALGYFTATPTGYYGPVTADAVKKFQAAKGISQIGIVGPQTRTALNSSSGSETNSQTTTPSTGAASPSTSGDGYVFKNFMGYGETPEDGPDVMELQKRLASLGYFTADATGYFGNITVTAVKKFQAAKGIEQTGYVGAQTRAALNK